MAAATDSERNDERNDKRLRWRCRRGSKELDVLLSTFVDAHYHRLDAADRGRFDRLLDSADPQLTDWLCHRAPPEDPGIANIVERILAAHRA